MCFSVSRRVPIHYKHQESYFLVLYNQMTSVYTSTDGVVQQTQIAQGNQVPTAYVNGSGDPNGLLSAISGEYYWDTTNKALYLCSSGTVWVLQTPQLGSLSYDSTTKRLYVNYVSFGTD